MISSKYQATGPILFFLLLIVFGIVIVLAMKMSKRQMEQQKRDAERKKQGYSIRVTSTVMRDGVVVESRVIGDFELRLDGAVGAGGGGWLQGSTGHRECDSAGHDGDGGADGGSGMNSSVERGMQRLLYPGKLVEFEELARGGHGDPRALIYTIHRFDTERTRPFYAEELNARDFAGGTDDGREAARLALLEKGLIAPVAPEEELQIIFLKDQLGELLRARGLSDRGRKAALAKRLSDSGYEIDRSTYKEGLFRLTERGIEAVERHRAEKREAIRRAVNALCSPDHETVTAFCGHRQNAPGDTPQAEGHAEAGDALDVQGYEGAVAAYRAFDDTWGFVHSSGKRHTIFAHKDIPIRQFAFLETYPMREANNTEEFRTALRACLIAGLMRGCQDKMELAGDFVDVCSEVIDCPGVVTMYDLDRRDPKDREIRDAMIRNVLIDKRYELEYYISRLLYLSRRSG